MAYKFTIFIISSIAIAGSVTGKAVRDEPEVVLKFSEHHISGASGTFRYTLSGELYERNERVLITVGFPENTVFIIENYDIEVAFETLSIHKWSRDDLVLDKTYTGKKTTPTYFLPEGNFLVVFESDGTVTKTGFNFRWAPLDTLLLH